MLRLSTRKLLAGAVFAASAPAWSLAHAQHQGLPLTSQDRDRLAPYRAKMKSAVHEPLPRGFIAASSNEGLRLTATVSHSNPMVQAAFVPQSELFSCAVATLGAVLVRSELEAFEVMCQSLPDMQIQHGEQNLVPSVLAASFDPRMSALWVPGVMDVTNFAICVKKGQVDASNTVVRV